ncbi:MAG: hypothetical protein KDA42_13055 [Planctomycetales bacterium]|nr:hypothetical protein [Planctomycetales bacterium]
MPHPIEQQVTVVASRARRAFALRGVAAWLAVVVAALMILGACDFVLRYQDPGLRILASLAALVAIAWGANRYLRSVVFLRIDALDVAQRIERRYPELKQSLSSAIVFLRQEEGDAGAGSSTLRRAAIAEATAGLETVDLEQVVNFQPTRRAVAIAGAALVMAFTACAANSEAVVIALSRLANPFGATSWPRVNELAFRRPLTKLAAGQTFEVELIDRNGQLPDEVRIEFRYASEQGWTAPESELMQLINDAMLFRKETVSRPFQYRATGGDDDTMAWLDLQVVEPPRIEILQARIYPPNYTGLPATDSERQIRALQGSQIALRGSATKELSRANLRMDDGTVIPASLSDNGLEFRVERDQFVLQRTGSYWFELFDLEGLSGRQPERYTLEAVPDSPPSVVFEQPAAANFFTADAVVPIEILVKDDLRIRDVFLRYTRSDRSDRSDEGEFARQLYVGPESVHAENESSELVDGERRTIRHTWALAELNLQPGAQISLVATASDYLPQVGQSLAPRRINIITPAELEDRLALRQRLILAELSRALEMEKTTRSQLEILLIQAREVGHFERSDIDQLQAAELNQRQVQRTLTDRDEGIPQYIESLLADLDNNRIDSPDIRRRMEEIRRELGRLKNEELARIESRLTAAIKSAQSAAPEPETQSPAPREPIEVAAQQQDRVIDSLNSLLGDLTQWTDYRRLSREVRLIREGQQRLTETTRRIGTGAEENDGTLLKSTDELAPQQSADLQKAASEQHELARSLEKLLQTMESMAEKLTDDDPLAAATLEDAVSAARGENGQTELSGQMRGAADLVRRNEIGQALDAQQQASATLNEILDILANRREAELSRLVEKLREAEQQLDTLRNEQRGLRKKMEEAAAETDEQERKRQLERLQRQQKEIQEQLERMSRRLQRLQAQRAGRSAQNAAEKLGAACEACQGGDGAAAADRAEAAEKDLEEAAQTLAETRQQAEADLANEQMARFEDALAGMIQLQQRLLDDTSEIASRISADTPDEVFPSGIDDLSRAQLALGEQVAQQAQKMDQRPVFQLALEAASDVMKRAGNALARGVADEPTQAQQAEALQRLKQLLEAIAPDKNDGANQEGEGQGGAGQGGGGQAGNSGIQDIAQLKLVKLLQENLNRRFETLRKSLDQGDPGVEHLRDQQIRLADEQGRLADLVLDLVVAEDPAVGDDPDKLPDLDLERALDEENLDLPPLELELDDAQ